MIKRAVIGYLIQWSPHSSYDILFRRNYAAPTAPHVFIASSTHVKLKSSLCTWYSIIARRNRRAQWENVKAANLPCLPRRSALCHHRALVHAQGTPTGIWILNRNWNVSRLGCVELTHSPCSFFFLHVTACVCVNKHNKGQNDDVKKNPMTVQILATCFFTPSQKYYLIHGSLVGEKEKLLEELLGFLNSSVLK